MCYRLGCTDPNAYNYNPEATRDDGSCEYKVVRMQYQGKWPALCETEGI